MRLYPRHTLELSCSLDFPVRFFWPICHPIGLLRQNHNAKIAAVLALFVTKMDVLSENVLRQRQFCTLCFKSNQDSLATRFWLS